MFEGAVTTPERFNQFELNDLIRHLNLSKETSEVFTSMLYEKNFFQFGANNMYFQRREKDLLLYFSNKNT